MTDETTPVVEEEVKTEETPVETPETPEKDEILEALTETEDESEETPKVEPKEEVDETESEEKEKSDDETKTEEEPKEEALSPEEKEKEQSRNQYANRQNAIAERKARVKTQTDGYVSQGEDDQEQRIRAIEVQEYNRIIDHNEQTLIGEFDRVKANPDLQIFNSTSEQYNEKAYNKAMKDYNAGYLGYDANGNLTEVKGSLYQHLNETADLYQGAVKSGQIQQVRDNRKMNNNSDPKVAAPPKEVEKDPILDILMSD